MNANVWEGIVSHTYIQLTSFTHNKVYCMKLQLHDGVCHYVFFKLKDCSVTFCLWGSGSMATSSLSGSWPHGFRCLTCFALPDCGAAADRVGWYIVAAGHSHKKNTWSKCSCLSWFCLLSSLFFHMPWSRDGTYWVFFFVFSGMEKIFTLHILGRAANTESPGRVHIPW